MKELPPRVRLVRRASDFQRRSTTNLLQIGTTCCTCCLVWVGSALGGSLGLVHGWRALRTRATNVHRRRVLVVYALSVAAVFAFYCRLMVGRNDVFQSMVSQAFFGGLIFVSPLNFLPPGILALLTAAWSARHSPPEERDAVRKFACRLVWMSFNYASVGWVICVGLMVGRESLQLRESLTPLGWFIAAWVSLAVVFIVGMWWNARTRPVE